MEDYIKEYGMKTVLGAIVGFFGFLGKKKINKLECKIKEQEAIKNGVQALLRDRIIQSYNHYVEKGYCPIYAMENIQNMYNKYHDLGGNGTVTNLLNKLKELPTESEEKE